MMKKVVFILATLFLSQFNKASAQVDAPELRCIAVEDNGDITLTWIPSKDPFGQFVSYDIYASKNGGTFTPFISLTNRLQNTYRDLGTNFPNPNNNFKYYIATSYNDGSSKVSSPSDTLAAMELNVTKLNPSTSGDVKWNLMRTNPLPTWDLKYNLKRKLDDLPPQSPPIAWLDLAFLDYAIVDYRDNITRCLQHVYYRIELKDASGCVSTSNSAVVNLKDTDPADTMNFTRITVNKNGSTRLNWNKHPDGSVVGYWLFYKDPNGTTLTFDTVSAVTFEWNDVDLSRSANRRSQCYLIAAVDSCGKSNGGATTHCTMFLDHTFDQCKGEVTLSWTPYIGWPKPITEYNIYQALNGDTNYSQIGTVTGADTSFIVKKINALNKYSFYIQANDNSGLYISNSNINKATFNASGSTEFMHLRSASIVSEKEVELRVLLDRKSPFKYINIYRAVRRRGPFKKVETLTPPTNNPLDTLFSLMDTTGRPYQINYIYYLELLDTCEQVVRKSNNFRTIHLSGWSNKYDMENELKWAANISEDSTAIEQDVYSIYRGINRSYASDPIRTLWANSTQYLDDISQEIHTGDEFCYQIKLAQAPSDTFVLPDTSLSNEICFKIEPDIFIPNTFTPNNDGKNEIWKPSTSYIIPFENYLLQIYDRWGKLAFETTDPRMGWDGTRNEGFAKMGLYVYHLEVTTVYGSKIERKGNFNLVR